MKEYAKQSILYTTLLLREVDPDVKSVPYDDLHEVCVQLHDSKIVVNNPVVAEAFVFLAFVEGVGGDALWAKELAKAAVVAKLGLPPAPHFNHASVPG